MRLLFATRRSHLPDRVGGAQHSMHALLTLVQARGHACEAIAALPEGARFTVYRIGRRLSGRRWLGWRDERTGYPTWRTAATLVPALLARRLEAAAPDLVVTDYFPPNDIAAVAAQHGVPTLLRMVDVTFDVERTPIPQHPLVLPFANSAFVAMRVAARTGRPSPVVHPVVHAERYRVERDHPDCVTFINPIPLKGVDTVLEMARLLPHRRFLFVESWPLSPARRAGLAASLQSLPNVTLRGWSLDVRPVYAQTRLLVVPSQAEEAFGRVAIEAQASGIPVVARAVGGLPEAVGAGGVLLPPDAGPARWAEEVERLFRDPEAYAALSGAAYANAARPDLAPDAIVERFLAIAARHVERCAAAGCDARDPRSANGQTARSARL